MAEKLFEITNALALFSWLFLIIFPYKEWSRKLLFNLVVIGLALLYLVLITQYFDVDTFESFGDLNSLSAMFSEPMSVVIGWTHYLAFDLLAGLYITKDAEKYAINRFLLIPCQLLTFMMGPVGVFLYFLLRASITKKLIHPF